MSFLIVTLILIIPFTSPRFSEAVCGGEDISTCMATAASNFNSCADLLKPSAILQKDDIKNFYQYYLSIFDSIGSLFKNALIFAVEAAKPNVPISNDQVYPTLAQHLFANVAVGNLLGTYASDQPDSITLHFSSICQSVYASVLAGFLIDGSYSVAKDDLSVALLIMATLTADLAAFNPNVPFTDQFQTHKTLVETNRADLPKLPQADASEENLNIFENIKKFRSYFGQSIFKNVMKRDLTANEGNLWEALSSGCIEIDVSQHIIAFVTETTAENPDGYVQKMTDNFGEIGGVARLMTLAGGDPAALPMLNRILTSHVMLHHQDKLMGRYAKFNSLYFVAENTNDDGTIFAKLFKHYFEFARKALITRVSVYKEALPIFLGELNNPQFEDYTKDYNNASAVLGLFKANRDAIMELANSPIESESEDDLRIKNSMGSYEVPSLLMASVAEMAENGEFIQSAMDFPGFSVNFKKILQLRLDCSSSFGNLII